MRQLRANVSQGTAHLTVSGTVGDVLKLTDIDLGVKCSGKSLELKNFTAAVDQSDFTGWTTVEFGKRPRVTARLESGLVDFTRIMQQAEGEKKANAGNTEKGLLC